MKIPAAILFLVFLLSPFFYIIIIYTKNYEIISKNEDYNPIVSTIIYDRKKRIIAELYEENRQYVQIKKIPQILIHAFLAAEDQHFYYHPGVDIGGIIRAFFINIAGGSVKQGGSTITQQLAKQLYAGNARTLERKVVELFIARELERRFTKDKILEMYLNQIYFGHGVYGVQAASRFYFKKNLTSLSAVESAVLAGIPSAPGKFSPIKNPRFAIARNKQILFTMIQLRYIKKTSAIKLYNSFWKNFISQNSMRYPHLGVRNKSFNSAPHFTEYIRRILIKKYGKEKIYRGGLRVYTTLDLDFQKTARDLITKKAQYQQRFADNKNRYKLKHLSHYIAQQTLKKKRISKKEIRIRSRFLKKLNTESIGFIGELFDIPVESLWNTINVASKIRSQSRVEGALIAMDPFSGAILTMVGGRSFEENNQFNRAIQSLRQPGSAFKPFVYGAALEKKKISPGTPFLDVPVIFRDSKKTWSPSNYGKKFHGTILTRKALARSLNIVSVRIFDMVGGEHVADFSSRIFNIPRERITIDPTLALGSTELSPLELARGYGAIANGGYRVNAVAINKITDSQGNIIYQKPRKKRIQVMTKEVSFLLTSLLKSVVDQGTARGSIRGTAQFWHPAAGKTGTNSQYRDAWFAGFTPDLVTVVWFGCNSQKFSLGYGQSGSAVAAPIWGKFMKSTRNKKLWFKLSKGNIKTLSICKYSGLKPGNNCIIKKEYFIPGTAPQSICTSDHKKMKSIFDLAKERKPANIDN